MSKVIDRVRKAVVVACMKEGIEDMHGILNVTTGVLRTIGKNSVSAHKAWATIRSQKQNRKQKIGSRR